MNRNPHVAVVGATGAVGMEMIKTLEKRNVNSNYRVDPSGKKISSVERFVFSERINVSTARV